MITQEDRDEQKNYIFLCKYSMYQLHDSCSGSVNQDLNLNHNNMYTWDIHQHLSNVQLYVWDEDEGWRRKKWQNLLLPASRLCSSEAEKYPCGDESIKGCKEAEDLYVLRT